MAPTGFPFPKPKIPDVEDRLPFIWRQLVDPCDAPITVWVNAFWPALKNALITWYQVDLLQVVRTMFKPPTFGWVSRGGRHGSRGSRSRPRALKRTFKDVVSFDPNDWVGNKLSPFADEEMIMLLPGEVWFWSGIELVTIGLFAFQIIDVSTAFAYEWTSGVAQSKYCQARDDAVLYASAPGYPLIGIFGWDAVGILDATKMRNIAFFDGFGVMQDIGPGMVSLVFSWKNTGGGPGGPSIECRLTCLNGPRQGSYAHQMISNVADASGANGCSYDMSAGEIWIGEIRVNGGYQIIDPVLWCHARGTP